MKKEILLHLQDGIRSLREPSPDIAQAEHNFFEIAEHLGISTNELVEKIKRHAATFSYTINVFASNKGEAEAAACEIWDEVVPRKDEMNIEVCEGEG